jgi:hypothetical protein
MLRRGHHDNYLVVVAYYRTGSPMGTWINELIGYADSIWLPSSVWQL